MGAYIPESMRAARRWVLWDEKKIPWRADGKGKADPTNPATWADFETASFAAEHGRAAGLGFVFAPGDGLVFIDIDDCITDGGELTETAQAIVDLFPNTYTEYSQSETGLHIVARGVLPCNGRRIAGVMEIYAAGRYMAFTGNAYTAAEPAQAQTAIDTLCSRYKIEAEPEATPTPAAQISKADAEIIARCMNGGGSNGPDFRALWAGDWSKYHSQSEADYRLLEILYYYSRNGEQAARIFKQSPLGQRGKARRADYIARTIKQVIADRNTRTGTAFNGHHRRGNLTDTPTPKSKYNRFR